MSDSSKDLTKGSREVRVRMYVLIMIVQDPWEAESARSAHFHHAWHGRSFGPESRRDP